MPAPTTIPVPIAGLGYSLQFLDDFSTVLVNPNMWDLNGTADRTVNSQGNTTYFNYAYIVDGDLTYQQGGQNIPGSNNYNSILNQKAVCVTGSPGSSNQYWYGSCISTTSSQYNASGTGHWWQYMYNEWSVQLPGLGGNTNFPGPWCGPWLIPPPGSEFSSDPYDETDICQWLSLYSSQLQPAIFMGNEPTVGAGINVTGQNTQLNLYQMLWTTAGTWLYYNNSVIISTTAYLNQRTTPMCLVQNIDMGWETQQGQWGTVPSSVCPTPCNMYSDYVWVWQLVTTAPTGFYLTGTGGGTGGVQTQCAVFLNGPAPTGGVIYTPTSTFAGNSDKFQATLGGGNVTTIMIPAGSTYANFYLTPHGPAGTRTIGGTVVTADPTTLTNLGTDPVTYTATSSSPSGGGSSGGSAGILVTL